MDAQAQDRAHRIGQTREVHIYRLVSSDTVEENILIKAQQKRHLDFLVMAEGGYVGVGVGLGWRVGWRVGVRVWGLACGGGVRAGGAKPPRSGP